MLVERQVIATLPLLGLNPSDLVRVEFVVGPFRTGVLNFNGSADSTLPATEVPTSFTQIGTDVTGSTFYTGTLIGTGGETNFSAARISITQ